jgi:hypothetical protein
VSKKHRKHDRDIQPAVVKYATVNYAKKYAAHPRYYVGYGSNHNVIQMQARCTDAMPVLAGMMPDKRLVFSSVLTVEDAKGESTPVSVWHVSPRDIAALDRYEGFPTLYGKRYTHVTVDGLRVAAFYYTLNQPYHETPPSTYYYTTCEEGYRDFGLDLSYLEAARDRAVLATEARAGKPRPCDFCSELVPEGQMVRLDNHTLVCKSCGDYMTHYTPGLAPSWTAPYGVDDELDWGGPRDNSSLWTAADTDALHTRMTEEDMG